MTAQTQNIDLLTTNGVLPVKELPGNDICVLPEIDIDPSKNMLVTVDQSLSNVTKDDDEGVLPPYGTKEYYSIIGRMGGLKKIYTPEHLHAIGLEMLEWMKNENNVFFKQFLLQHGLHKDLIYRYEEDNPAFSGLLKIAREMQEFKLAHGGLTGKFRDAMAIFALKNNNHAWSDRHESTVTHQTAPVQIVLGLPFSLPSNTHNELPPPAPFTMLPPQSGSTSS